MLVKQPTGLWLWRKLFCAAGIYMSWRNHKKTPSELYVSCKRLQRNLYLC